MGRSRVPQAEVDDWLDTYPDATGTELGEHFGVSRQQGSAWKRRWLKAKGEPAPGTAPTKKPRNLAAGRTPAAEMAPDDRARAIRTVRNAGELLDNMIGRLARHVADTPEGEVPELSVKNAQALLALQRMATGVQDSYPGLFAMVAESGGSLPTEDDITSILESMKEPEPRG